MERRDLFPAPPAGARISTEQRRTEPGAEREGDGEKVKDSDGDYLLDQEN